MDATQITYFWLILGVALLALEAFGLPGVGLMFAGLGALAAGIALQLGLIAPEAYLAQAAVFLLATIVFTALLWKPLQKFHIRVKNKPGYDSLIGAEAVVHAAPLSHAAQGQVLWSGTIMAAKLAPHAPGGPLPIGARVIIEDAQGALLIVRPHPSSLPES